MQYQEPLDPNINLQCCENLSPYECLWLFCDVVTTRQDAALNGRMNNEGFIRKPTERNNLAFTCSNWNATINLRTADIPPEIKTGHLLNANLVSPPHKPTWYFR
jgi:hypothetical protein